MDLRYVEQVFQEIKKTQVDAQKYISNFADRHPGLFKSIQTKQAAQMILNEQKHVVDNLFHEGSINAEEHTEIRDELDVKINNLDHENIEWEDWGQSNNLLMICPHLPKLQGSLLNELDSKKRAHKFRTRPKPVEGWRSCFWNLCDFQRSCRGEVPNRFCDVWTRVSCQFRKLYQ